MLEKRTLPLSALRAFESAGRHLHLGRAGDELGVTHGAVSHQIRALEAQLGVKLFNRTSNHLRLTDSGRHLLTAVSEGLDKILDAAIHLNPDSLSGNLIVACTQTAGESWMAKHICDFHKLYPQIEIHITEIKPEQKEIPREIDIAICYGKPHAGDRQVEEFASLHVFPVCSPRLLHGKTPITKPQQLISYPLLHDTINSWSCWFSSMNIDIPDRVKQIYFFNTTLSLNAARNGYGIALCNHFEIEEDLREGRLIQLLDITIQESHSYYLLLDKPEQQSLKVTLFEEYLKNAVN